MTLHADESYFTQPMFEMDATPQLEKEYCTNYTCCGLRLADLHELVGHFEEQHVTVVSPTGMPLWCGSPSSAGASSGSASPASPYPLSHPFPTLTSAFTPVMTSGSRDPGAYLAQNCLAKEEERVFDTMLHTEAYDAPASVVPQYTIGDTNASYGTTHDATGDISSDVPANPPATHVHLPTIAPTPVHARPPTLSIITDTERGRTWAEKRKKGRARMHKCPHDGCIKTYLNLNGLKYHLTKGVCVFS